MKNKNAMFKAPGKGLTLALILAFFLFSMGGLAYKLTASTKLFRGITAIEYGRLADLVEDAMDEATDDTGGTAIEGQVIADAVADALEAAMQQILQEREDRLAEAEDILDLVRTYLDDSELVLQQVNENPENPQLDRSDRQELLAWIDDASEKIALLETYVADAVEQEDFFRDIYLQVEVAATPLGEYDAIEEAYTDLQDAIEYREALEALLNTANNFLNTLIGNYNEILGHFDDPRPVTFKLKVFDWKGDFMAGLTRNEIQLSQGSVLLSSDLYSIQENSNYYALTFTAVPDTLYSLYAQVDGYVGQRFKNKISTADANKTYNMNLQAAYVFEVQDAEDDELISGADVSVGSIDCSEGRDHLYYCLVPSDSTADSYRIEESDYETQEEDLLFPRDGDYQPSQKYTVELNPKEEDRSDDNNNDGQGSCEDLDLTVNIRKIKEEDEPKRVRLTVEIDASDSDWEGNLILTENGDVFEEDRVSGRSVDEEYSFDARIGDSVTAYIEDETNDCFDSLAFTEDFSEILEDENFVCTNPFTDNDDELLCRMREAGIIVGLGGGKFGNRTITEAEWVKVLLSSQGYTASDARGLPSVSFLPNYDENQWYDPWYRIAVDEQIIRGYAEPSVPVTRARASVLAARAPATGELTLYNWDESDVPFNDLEKDPSKSARSSADFIQETYAIILLNDSIADMPDLGKMPVISGYPDGSFRPYENIEREHAMYLLYRWLLAFDLASPLDELD